MPPAGQAGRLRDVDSPGSATTGSSPEPSSRTRLDVHHRASGLRRMHLQDGLKSNWILVRESSDTTDSLESRVFICKSPLLDGSAIERSVEDRRSSEGGVDSVTWPSQLP